MPTSALIVGVVFVPPARDIAIPLLVFPLAEFVTSCPLPLLLLSIRFEDIGSDSVDVNEVTVDVRIVERDAANVVTIRPCRTKSL